MKLIEALKIIQGGQPTDARTLRVSLICGFTPLHLATFLNAHLRVRARSHRVDLAAGNIFGDLLGNLRTVVTAPTDVCVVVVEWSDLDARLGTRGLGSWSPSAFVDILRDVKTRTSQIAEALRAVSEKTTTVVCFPTLPFPAVSFTPGWQASAFELELRAWVTSAALETARISNVRVVNSQRVDQTSPLSERLDIKSELVSGFPYRLAHASTVAETLSQLALPAMSKKGLITDLDDTLWDGILGEIGDQAIAWDLDHHAHMHGVYQRLLHALSEAGVLIGVASKNDPSEVEKAFQRHDLIVPSKCFFPVEAHWQAKSESVRRIIEKWNVGADSVVFIDDSPMELAEVKAAHPDIECLLFEKDDPHELEKLFRHLRDLFGKDRISDEDRIRSESLRQTRMETQVYGNNDGATDEFLKQAEPELTLSFSKHPIDPRALELVNKTNQFNLNGIRHTESSWQSLLADPQTIFLIVSYRDKYGPLGKIAVMTGRKKGSKILVETWVMSCRAFSRRIEHRCLEELFERFDAAEIEFAYEPTSKNGPVRDFLKIITSDTPTGPCSLSRGQFAKYTEKTFHRVLEVSHR